MQAEVVQESKTFFSVAAHYAACVNPGKAVLENGVKATFGEKYLEFSPTAGPDKGTYGVLSTDDPEKIAWLEKEIARGNTDIMTPDQFYERTTPSETKIRALRAEQEAVQRELTLKNQLLADLQTSNPELYAKIVKAAAAKK